MLYRLLSTWLLLLVHIYWLTHSFLVEFMLLMSAERMLLAGLLGAEVIR